MIRIVSDTSTLYSSQQAKDAGFEVSPLSVTIAGSSYREFDEISSQDFVEIIRKGNMPVSSQPSIGDVTELYERYQDDDILNIAMAEGLSGTYNSAAAAAEICKGDREIVVINSRTLCGPHRYLVEKAVDMANTGKTLDEIVKHTEALMDSAKSYLIPADFDYLRRGGRLSPLVSYVGQATKLSPILTQTNDGRQLTIASVRRGFAHAIQYVGKALQKIGVGEGWRIYITHAAAPHLAEQAHELLKKVIPDAVFEIYLLSPAFITQGGPDCVAVQIIKSEP
ncbi:MAG: DegV family protein [Oscillospiraceae bacterium]|nr:DegV family protein [Oscillospiraceae bacterium]